MKGPCEALGVFEGALRASEGPLEASGGALMGLGGLRGLLGASEGLLGDSEGALSGLRGLLGGSEGPWSFSHCGCPLPHSVRLGGVPLLWFLEGPSVQGEGRARLGAIGCSPSRWLYVHDPKRWTL